MPGEHALAVIPGWPLRELTRARDVAAADVEPVAREPPLRHCVHSASSPKLRAIYTPKAERTPLIRASLADFDGRAPTLMVEGCTQAAAGPLQVPMSATTV